MKKILAIIPARGGSKRIPKKNIKKLGKKPLIAWTIDEARKSKLITDVIVSTDDKDISDVSKKFKADVIERPKILATDWAKTIDVVLHSIRGIEYELIVCLQPTSPFRTAEDIDKAINLFIKNKCESVIGVCEVVNQSWFMKMKEKYLLPVYGHKYLGGEGKDLPKIYVPNGAIYISTIDNLFKYKSFYNNKVLPYVMPRERSLDIDDMDDWVIAEAIVKK